jgi:outer membrane protein OmpA-like peptidoglycan-associated protein
MKKNLLYILISIFLFFNNTKAQTNLNLYNFRNVGQSNLLNPGIRPLSNFTFGLPSLYVSGQMPEMTLANLFNKEENADSTFRRIVRDPNLSFNNIGISTVIDPIFIGFAIKKNYFSIGVQFNYDFMGSPPKDILGLMQGSTFFQNSLNRPADLGNIDFNTSAWMSYHVGYTREITKKLSIGARVKYLQGIFNLNTEQSTLKFASNEDSLYLKAGFKVNIAGVEDLRKNDFNLKQTIFSGIGRSGKADSTFNEMDYLYEFLQKRENISGTGWGIDFGANYRFNQHLSVSASVLDLGYITWDKNYRNYNLDTKEFNYKGVDLKELNQFDSLEKRITEIQDSITNKVFVPTESTNSYSTNLNAKLYLGAQYALNYNNMFDFVFFNNFGTKTFNPALSLSFTKKVWSILDLRISGTYYNKTFNNAGVGFSLNLGPFQTYLFSDNLIAVMQYDEAKFVNIRAGINWNIGRNNDRDGDGIPNIKDKCWKNYGTIALNGCSDYDNDGVSDNEDDCIDIPGKPCTNGCPDKDNDCVADINDSCINDSGNFYLNGCPGEFKDTMEIVLPIEELKILNDAINNIEFELETAELKDSSLNSLEELAKLLTIKPEYNIIINSYADTISDNKKHLKLIPKRAKTLIKFLSKKGIAEDRISAYAFESKLPFTLNKNAETKNYLIEIKIVK